jgi:CubicO group peptidase (beta-lactamase class C family)
LGWLEKLRGPRDSVTPISKITCLPVLTQSIEQTKKVMTEPYRLPHDGTVDGFGLGWFFDNYRGMKAVHYGGGTPQVSGFVFFVPEKRIAISGLFNLQDIPAAERIALAEAIADIVLGNIVSVPGHPASQR